MECHGIALSRETARRWMMAEGIWLDRKERLKICISRAAAVIDLARVYAEIWKDAAPAHLVDVAVFCDSDDTHTASISYFDYVRLEER